MDRRLATIELLTAFVVSFLAATLVIPPIRRAAVTRRLLDFPDGDRRTHKRPVPRLGGVAVFFGFVVAVAAAAVGRAFLGRDDAMSLAHVGQMLVACALLFGVGLADDLHGVSPVTKLAVQTAAALIVQYHWVLMSAIIIPPAITIHVGWLAVPIMVLWLVGASNALNLVDGLDGLAGGVAVIALLTSAVSAMLLDAPPPVTTIALMGATVGFLRYNWPPAKIFLGDSGSLVIGFLLAFLAVRGATTSQGATLAILPIFALAYPLLDTGIAMLRRWLRGHPLSRADGRHVHHQLLALHLSDRRAVWLIYLYSAGVAALGLLVAFAPPRVTLGAAVAGLAILGLIFVFGVRWLEYHEFLDAGAIIRSAGSLARSAIRNTIHAHDVAALVKNAESLAQIDEILEAHAQTFNFAHMHLGSANARLPAASWWDEASHWKLEYPVLCPAEHGVSRTGRLDESLVLTVWCSKRTSGRAASAEQVAHVVADAIAAWTAAAPLPIHQEIRLRARTPAGAAPAVDSLRGMAGRESSDALQKLRQSIV